MAGLIQRLTGGDNTTDPENEDEHTSREVGELVLKDVLGDEFDIDDAPIDRIVEYDDVKEIQKLGVYEEDRNDSRMVGLMGRHSESFNAYIRVLDREEDGLTVKIRSVFYTEDELDNDVVGDFVRSFSHRGPDVHFDIEGNDPEMRVYSF